MQQQQTGQQPLNPQPAQHQQGYQLGFPGQGIQPQAVGGEDAQRGAKRGVRGGRGRGRGQAGAAGRGQQSGNGYGGQGAAAFPPHLPDPGRQTVNQQAAKMGNMYGSAMYQNQAGQYGVGPNQQQPMNYGQMTTPVYNQHFPALQHQAGGQAGIFLNQPPPPPPAQQYPGTRRN